MVAQGQKGVPEVQTLHALAPLPVAEIVVLGNVHTIRLDRGHGPGEIGQEVQAQQLGMFVEAVEQGDPVGEVGGAQPGDGATQFFTLALGFGCLRSGAAG